MTWKGPGHTWDGGKSDDQSIAAARAALVDSGIHHAAIFTEPYLLIPLLPSLRTCLLTETAEDPPGGTEGRYTVRHPDLVVAASGVPLLIVEVDGSWHDTIPGRKATDRRNRDYRAAGIPFVEIHLSEYPDGGWEPMVRRAVELHGLAPSAAAPRNTNIPSSGAAG